MNGILHWFLAAGAALFAVAILVAWWEHLGRQSDNPTHERRTEAPRPVRVDVELDALSPTAAGADAAARRDALDGALDRMAVPGAAPRKSWNDTVPMIGPGPAIDPVRNATTSSR